MHLHLSLSCILHTSAQQTRIQIDDRLNINLQLCLAETSIPQGFCTRVLFKTALIFRMYEKICLVCMMRSLRSRLVGWQKHCIPVSSEQQTALPKLCMHASATYSHRLLTILQLECASSLATTVDERNTTEGQIVMGSKRLAQMIPITPALPQLLQAHSGAAKPLS